MSTRSVDEHDRLRAALVELTPAQALAADALATGSTHAEAAEVAGVTRETVTRWTNHHPGVREALDRYRHALAFDAATAACRIRGKALAVVERHLDGDTDDVSVALAVLRVVLVSDLGRAAAADEHLAAATRRVALSVSPPPMRRTADGRISFIDSLDHLDYDTRGEEAERAERIAVELLAYAAGVREG